MRQSTQQLEPAKSIVAALGGVRATAKVCECAPSAVSRWMMPKEKRGTGGKIPQRHWGLLIAVGKKRGLGITLARLAAL